VLPLNCWDRQDKTKILSVLVFGHSMPNCEKPLLSVLEFLRRSRVIGLTRPSVLKVVWRKSDNPLWCFVMPRSSVAA